jgi:hypothetical protein
MQLSFPQKFIAQPVIPIVLNRSHPLARGLRYSISLQCLQRQKAHRGEFIRSPTLAIASNRTFCEGSTRDKSS